MVWYDGTTFTTDKKVGLGDFGPNYYAAQTFNNSPDGRTVIIGWMKKGNDIFLEGKMPFNSQMSFPTSMELRTTSDGIRLYRWPVDEIENLYIKSHKFKNLTIKKAAKKLVKIKVELIDMSVEFEAGSSLKLTIRGQEVSYEPENEIFVFGKNKLAAPAINGKVKLRVLLDRASIELFVNEGALVSTNYAVPEADNHSISVSADGEVKINSLIINELKSSW